jgi:hypothetical protein
MQDDYLSVIVVCASLVAVVLLALLVLVAAHRDLVADQVQMLRMMQTALAIHQSRLETVELLVAPRT